MPQIRIRGLVKAMNAVRQQLADGIPKAEAAAFRQQVLGMVAEVEKLCRQNGTTPKQLPPPSFRAYTFLKRLDLQDLPLVEQGVPVPVQQLRIKNLVSICSTIQKELADLACPARTHPATPSRRARAGLRQKIQAHAETVEALARQAGTTPAALPVRSRRAYQWLKFLSEPANLQAHLAQLAGTYRLAEAMRARHTKEVHFELYPMSHLYRLHPEKTHRRMVINEGYIGAPRTVLKAFIRVALGLGMQTDHQRVRAYADTDDFAEVVQALEVISVEPNGFTQGRVYNLEEVFEKVNARYFSGQMPRPQLTWNATLSKRKFGHYQPASDTVMLSITLDDPGVPTYVIEFVMYHELLHKALGVQVSTGRRYAHTREFREKEKLFQLFQEAQAYLNRLAKE